MCLAPHVSCLFVPTEECDASLSSDLWKIRQQQVSEAHHPFLSFLFLYQVLDVHFIFVKHSSGVHHFNQYFKWTFLTPHPILFN